MKRGFLWKISAGMILALCLSLIPISTQAATSYSNIQLRRGTAAAWAAANPILLQGEPAWETDTAKLKIGDGTTAYNSLAYYAPTASSATSYIIDVLTTYGGGTSYTDATITTALNAIGASTKVNIVLTPGTWIISNSIIFTSNINVIIPNGTSLQTATGKTTTFSGTIQAGSYQIFTGSGTATVNTFPKDQAWWGSAERWDVTNLLATDATFTNTPTMSSGVGFVPAGMVGLWPTETAPSGWLECAGQSLLRAGTYANLFAAIGTLYGTADGTHFNLPDWRGLFPRGWDHGASKDPDKATRTAPTATGATIVAGDHVGTEQVDDLESHVHTWNIYTAPGAGIDPNSGPGHGGSANTITTSGVGTKTGGSRVESRPKNFNVMWIMKY